MRIFITRPSDFASFCLYDGFLSSFYSNMTTVLDDGVIVTSSSTDFKLIFAGTPLPLAGAAALDLKSRGRYTGAKVSRLPAFPGYHSDEDDRCTTQRSRTHLARDGELHFRFFAGDFVTSPADLPGQTAASPTPPSYDAQGQPLERPSRVLRDHDDIVRYFESFAPFQHLSGELEPVAPTRPASRDNHLFVHDLRTPRHARL